MKEKKKIIIFIDWFVPAYKAGGPIQSVFNLVDKLEKQFDFYIITSDRDLGNSKPHQNIELNKWTTFKDIKVIYLSSEYQTYSFYKKILKEIDYSKIYLNSMFSINFSLLPLLAASEKEKVVLAPRGMLGEGALKLNPLKKKLFITFFKLFRLHKKITWQATALSEYNEITSVYGNKLSIKTAPNLSRKNTILNSKTKKVNELNLFFLSRISEKKNLIAVFEYLLDVNIKYSINLTIIGPIENVLYWESCQKLEKKTNNNITVNYLGSIPNLELPSLLAAMHCLILPTFNENFGHVIMESWQNACPVIISDQTPWRDLETKKIGWDIPLNQKYKFIEVIEKMAEMDQEEYTTWSQKSHKFAHDFCENPKLTKASTLLFTDS